MSRARGFSAAKSEKEVYDHEDAMEAREIQVMARMKKKSLFTCSTRRRASAGHSQEAHGTRTLMRDRKERPSDESVRESGDRRSKSTPSRRAGNGNCDGRGWLR